MRGGKGDNGGVKFGKGQRQAYGRPRNGVSHAHTQSEEGLKGATRYCCSLSILRRFCGPKASGGFDASLLLCQLPVGVASERAEAEAHEGGRDGSLSSVQGGCACGDCPSEIRKKRRREGSVMDSGGGGPVRCPHPPTPRTRLGL